MIDPKVNQQTKYEAAPDLNHERLHKQELHDVYGNEARLHSGDRVMDSDISPVEALHWLQERLAAAKLAGKYVAMVPGGFDVPHDNHEWYIRHCRLLAAKRSLQDNGIPLSVDTIRTAMDSSNLYLLVSIDSDEALNARKGGDPAKGGAPRPIYPWQSRAHRIAGYSYKNPETGEVHHAVDIVSKECSVNFTDTPLQNAASLSAYLHALGLLDTILVYPEHPQDEMNARANGIDPIVIPEFVYAIDPRTGVEFHSSDIIRGIRGDRDDEKKKE